MTALDTIVGWPGDIGMVTSCSAQVVYFRCYNQDHVEIHCADIFPANKCQYSASSANSCTRLIEFKYRHHCSAKPNPTTSLESKHHAF